MERRMRGNSHVRCGAGENLEITSKSYLSLKMSTLRNSPQGWHTSVDNVLAFCHELKTTKDKIHLASASTLGNAKIILGDCNGFGIEHFFRGQCRWGKYKGNEALIIKGKDTGFKTRIVIFSGAMLASSYKSIRGNSYGMWIGTEINLHHKSFVQLFLQYRNLRQLTQVKVPLLHQVQDPH